MFIRVKYLENIECDYRVKRDGSGAAGSVIVKLRKPQTQGVRNRGKQGERNAERGRAGPWLGYNERASIGQRESWENQERARADPESDRRKTGQMGDREEDPETTRDAERNSEGYVEGERKDQVAWECGSEEQKAIESKNAETGERA